MSKELPYFQFEPAQWLTGSIQFCSNAAKGYYMDIQCFYWQRECVMTDVELRRKFTDVALVDELLKENIIKIKGDRVIIQFLIDQYDVIMNRSKINSRNGKAGAAAKKMKRAQSSPVITPEVPRDQVGNLFYIGTKLFPYPVSKYVLSELQIHTSQFMPTVKPLTIEEVLKAMDVRYAGSQFTNHTHVIRAFDKTAKDLLAGKNKTSINNTATVAVQPAPFKHE